MVRSVALISRHPISKDELSGFILRNGGIMNGCEEMFGFLACDQGCIWIGLSPDDLASGIEDGGGSYSLALREMLGGSPRSLVIVDIGRQPASQDLVLDFARKLDGRWPLVVDDLCGRLLTIEEFLATGVPA